MRYITGADWAETVFVKGGSDLAALARNIPNRQRPVPNASRISRRVGTSRKDLIKPDRPKRINPCGRANPCQIESSQEGSVCTVQSAVTTSPSTNPVAARSSEKPSMLENEDETTDREVAALQVFPKN